jgi:hypothetical protein
MAQSIRFTTFLGFALLALVIAPVVSAQVQGPGPGSSPNSNISFTLHNPVSEQMVNQCNGETVDLSGELVFTYHYEVHPNGDVHQVIDTTTNLTGIGETTQAKYVSKDTTHTDLRVDPPQLNNPNLDARQYYTETDKWKLIAQGPTPDMTTLYVLHWSISSSGVLVWTEHPTITKCSR